VKFPFDVIFFHMSTFVGLACFTIFFNWILLYSADAERKYKDDGTFDSWEMCIVPNITVSINSCIIAVTNRLQNSKHEYVQSIAVSSCNEHYCRSSKITTLVSPPLFTQIMGQIIDK